MNAIDNLHTYKLEKYHQKQSSPKLLPLNDHLVKRNNSISLEKLHCKELYNMLVYISSHKPTSQLYF